jgi:Short C-terminal domain
MIMSAARILVVTMLCGIMLFGVAACGGGGAEVRSEVTTTTVGQQLMDLKKALDSGAMTQQEYEQQRKKILESR